MCFILIPGVHVSVLVFAYNELLKFYQLFYSEILMMIMYTGILFHPRQLNVYIYVLMLIASFVNWMINEILTYFGCLSFTGKNELRNARASYS